MYLNGMGIKGISRVTKISHTTILNWIQEAGESLSDEPQDEEIPEITLYRRTFGEAYPI